MKSPITTQKAEELRRKLIKEIFTVAAKMVLILMKYRYAETKEELKERNDKLMSEAQGLLEFIRTATLSAYIDGLEKEIERRKRIINWSHTVGSHSDDFSEKELCDCRKEEIKLETDTYNRVLSLLQQDKEGLQNNK